MNTPDQFPGISHGYESVTSQIPFEQTKIANAVQSILVPKTYTVKLGDTIPMIEEFFGIRGFGPSLLLGIKSLVGKTLVYHNGIVLIQGSETLFPVRSSLA